MDLSALLQAMTQQTGQPESPLFGPTMPMAQQAPPPMPPMPQDMPVAAGLPTGPPPPMPPPPQQAPDNPLGFQPVANDWKAQLPQILMALAGLGAAGNNPLGAGAYMHGFQQTQEDQIARAQHAAEQEAKQAALAHKLAMDDQEQKDKRAQLELERQKFVATTTENILKTGSGLESDEDRKNYYLGLRKVMGPLGVDTGEMVGIPVPGGAKKLQDEANKAVTGAMKFLSDQGKEITPDILTGVTVKIRGKDVPFIEAAAMAGMPMATPDMPNKDKSANLTLGDYYNNLVAQQEDALKQSGTPRKLTPGERSLAMKQAKKDWESFGWKPTIINAGGQIDMNAVAEEVMAGRQDPNSVGLYRYGAAFRSALAKKHFNLAKAQMEWRAVQRFISTAQGPQQLRVRQNLGTLTESLPLLRNLVTDWGASGLGILNRAQLAAAKEGVLGQAARQKAVLLDQQIGDVTAELAGVLMGGNAPTDPAFEAAGKSFQSNWDEKTLLAAIDQAEQNANFRKNAIENVGPAGMSDNMMHYGDTLDVKPPPGTPPPSTKTKKVGRFTVEELP